MDSTKPVPGYISKTRRKGRVSFRPDPEGVYEKSPTSRWAAEFGKRVERNRNGFECVCENIGEKGLRVPQDAADLRDCTDFMAVYTTEYVDEKKTPPPSLAMFMSAIAAQPDQPCTTRFWLLQLELVEAEAISAFDRWHTLVGKAAEGRRFSRIDEVTTWSDEMHDAVSKIINHHDCEAQVAPYCPRSGKQTPTGLVQEPWYRRLFRSMR